MSQYDKIAEEYDSLFLDKASIEENTEVGAMLQPLRGSVFDVGCGTGLLVEIVKIAPNDYFGVDPSKCMLERFVSKHKEYKDRLEWKYFEECKGEFEKYDNVISIFGSISYVGNEALRELNGSKCRLFLMFYKPTYHPVTYEKTGEEFSHYIRTEEELQLIFPQSRITPYHNYLIVERP